MKENKDNIKNNENLLDPNPIPGNNDIDNSLPLLPDNVNQNTLDFQDVSNKLLQQQQQNVFLPTTLLSMKLFKIISKTNAPLYLYNEIQEFMKLSFPIMLEVKKKKLKDRNKLLKDLYNIILNGSQNKHSRSLITDKYMFDLYPSIVKTSLKQSSVTVEIAKFDVTSMIVSLLVDPLLMQDDNLLMTQDGYLEPNSHTHSSYGDIHTGYWFKNAYNTLCKEPDDLLCPLILFIDSASLDAMQRQSLEPVAFTLGIFNRATRNSNKSWRVLGFIPNVEKVFNINYSKYRDSSQMKKEHYHQLLHIIISDIEKVQQQGGFKWTFKSGKSTP